MATTMAALRDRVHALMPLARSDLAELVACQSVADPRQFPASECLRAAQLVIDKFTAAGMQDVHLEDTPDGHPSVYGHIPAPSGAPTVLLYCHYDVQPPLDPTGEAWHSPPFELTERGGRWYGRGASDCKGNIVAHLTALRALGEERDTGERIRHVLELAGGAGSLPTTRLCAQRCLPAWNAGTHGGPEQGLDLGGHIRMARRTCAELIRHSW